MPIRKKRTFKNFFRRPMALPLKKKKKCGFSKEDEKKKVRFATFVFLFYSVDYGYKVPIKLITTYIQEIIFIILILYNGSLPYPKKNIVHRNLASLYLNCIYISLLYYID